MWNIENTYDFDAKLDTNLVFDTFSQSKSHQNINVKQIYAVKIILLKKSKIKTWIWQFKLLIIFKTWN